jgi:hypothetical protein
VITRRTGWARGAISVAGLTLVAALATPAVDASGATSAPNAGAATAPVVARNPKGRLLGAIPSRPAEPKLTEGVTAQVANPNVTTPVTYHNGPVQHGSSVYAIFWVPSGYPYPPGYAAVVEQFFKDLGHDSFTAGNPYGSDTQYYDVVGGKKRWVSYAVAYKGVVIDKRPFPANGCPNYLLNDGSMSRKCLNDSQVISMVKSVITSHHFPKGLNTQYFLFTPYSVASCFTANGLTQGRCYDPLNYNGYCAYHSFSGSGTSLFLYAAMHYADINGCSSGQSPQGNPADAVINGISHEHQETMTDPIGTGWYDSGGNEIADKCLFTFGTPLGTNGFGQYNQIINSNQYWLQEVWSNRDGACVQRNTHPQPTASFTYSPASPAVGTVVSFHSTSVSGDGTPLTYRWVWPNRTTSTAANPKFTFGTTGQKNVTLIVADTHGDQARAIRTVTVH